MTYDQSNIFARILRGEIPCDKVAESEHTLAFNDVNPRAPIHILVIPKGAYISMADFGAQASPEEMHDFFQTVSKIARDLGLNEKGYRTLSNHGTDGGQEVPHFHVHLFGGKNLGPMLTQN